MRGALAAAWSASVLGAFNAASDWAANYGYPAILVVVAGDGVFPLLPGETAIITGANFASQGKLTLPLVILAGAVGAVLGDFTAYWIGRAGGRHIKRAVARLAGQERLVAAERMVQRRGAALVFVGRFLPGLRLAINLSCGAGSMDMRRFLIFDALGALVWATQAGLIGYWAGKAFESRPWLGLLIALGVAALVAVGVIWRERRIVRREGPAGSKG